MPRATPNFDTVRSAFFLCDVANGPALQCRENRQSAYHRNSPRLLIRTNWFRSSQSFSHLLSKPHPRNIVYVYYYHDENFPLLYQTHHARIRPPLVKPKTPVPHTNNGASVATRASTYTDCDTTELNHLAEHRPASPCEANVDILVQLTLDKRLLGIEVAQVKSQLARNRSKKTNARQEWARGNVLKTSTPARFPKPLATNLSSASTALPKPLTVPEKNDLAEIMLMPFRCYVPPNAESISAPNVPALIRSLLFISMARCHTSEFSSAYA